jgi:hypothetical protein
MFKSHAPSEVTTIVPMLASDVGMDDLLEGGDRMIQVAVTDPVPACVTGTRSINAPLVEWNGDLIPATVARYYRARDRAIRAEHRAYNAAPSRRQNGPVIVSHDGMTKRARTAMLKRIAKAADANAKRFGPGWAD